jgi:hypothetical protein
MEKGIAMTPRISAQKKRTKPIPIQIRVHRRRRSLRPSQHGNSLSFLFLQLPLAEVKPMYQELTAIVSGGFIQQKGLRIG